jgi:hypothetical protein
MKLVNVLVSLVVAAFVVVIAFWLIGLLVAVIPAIAITLLKVLVVLLALGWILGFLGSHPNWF